MTRTRKSPLRRTRGHRFVVMLCLIAAAPSVGCGAAPVPKTPPPLTETESTVAMQIQRAEPLEGVVSVDVDCNEDRDERLDGIDDDCDGVIDEGHAQPAEVVVTFREEASIRLSVRDGAGEALHEVVASCSPGGFAQLSIASLPAGEYTIDVERLSECGGAGSISAAVALALANEAAEVYSAQVTETAPTSFAKLVVGPTK